MEKILINGVYAERAIIPLSNFSYELQVKIALSVRRNKAIAAAKKTTRR